MALTICNECGKEVSSSAESCPNCGNPINPIRTETTRAVVTPTPVEREEFPKWVIVPVVIIGALLIFLLFTLMSGNDENANDNVNVNITQDRPATTVNDRNPTKPADTTIVQSETTTAPTPVNEQQISPDTKTEVIENEPADDKGKVTLEAKVADKNGKVQSVRNEKFYLLDKDLESILREAKLERIENQSLVNSFGMSVLNPGKYREFNQKALNAINDHIKYDVLTDSAGKAEIGNIEPKNYYLFGIHKVGNSFAIWSSSVNIKKGENKLQFQPQRTTEIAQ